jgi:hypothetical protein
LFVRFLVGIIARGFGANGIAKLRQFAHEFRNKTFALFCSLAACS